MKSTQTVKKEKSSAGLVEPSSSLPVKTEDANVASVPDEEMTAMTVLIVTCGDDRYAIPQENLLELVRLGEDAKTKVEKIQDTPVYRLRGNLLPLVSLSEALQINGSKENVNGKIVVLQAGERRFGLLVDEIINTAQIEVQPLSHYLKDIPALAGATIQDEKVTLLLNIMGLAKQNRVIIENADQEALEEKSVASVEDINSDRQELLIIGIGKNEHMALPLSKVARLETFEQSCVEKSGAQDVVQYRGVIMPLIHLAGIFNQEESQSDKEVMNVVVHSNHNKSVGLVVSRIFDIVDEKISVKSTFNKQKVVETAVVQGHVTDLIDVEGIVREVDPAFYDEQLNAA